jgi:signal transduction histidine kinase
MRLFAERYRWNTPTLAQQFFIGGLVSLGATEALNNGYRHGGGIGQYVIQTYEGQIVSVKAGDRGPGFDPTKIKTSSLGLSGLRERVESLGGTFELKTSERGTELGMSLNLDEMEPS